MGYVTDQYCYYRVVSPVCIILNSVVVVPLGLIVVSPQSVHAVSHLLACQATLFSAFVSKVALQGRRDVASSGEEN